MRERAHRSRVYSGRVIFDHIPKTGGQAINKWLRQSLGSACVSPNLICSHSEIIARYGGLYSLLSGHVAFREGECLDPRYDYITNLRCPLDRALSWVYFVKDAPVDPSGEDVKRGARELCDSDGKLANDAILGTLRNPYVQHFSRIRTHQTGSGASKLDCAMAALQAYEIVGRFDDMLDFSREVAALLGLPAPTNLAMINVTAGRPSKLEAPRGLVSRLQELVDLDEILWKSLGDGKEPSVGGAWDEVDRFGGPTCLDSPDCDIESVILEGDCAPSRGGSVAVRLTFNLRVQVEELILGFEIADESHRLIFGTNTRTQGVRLRACAQGRYSAVFRLITNLPNGKYTMGVCVSAERSGLVRDIAQRMSAAEFHVVPPPGIRTGGCIELPAVIEVSRV